ncbi:hypothetical protein SAMN05216207_104330 [Pseudonocardia ammonioxydans]|uniref:Transmembrane protein n=1 Tax=Pseudonocardia ammonioxydans TaxID=260086 RepID=A0A1I5G514_PSUAM|nr:hypothetical protein [Pseudonocardia ammonioxydans]SFO31072.1 hypothetical protein SAMN05216207_104330 [Pseudonocardia ammonioxydans]
MPGSPELDQVREARRKLAAYAGFSRTYWVVHGCALVLLAGLPIWLSYLPGAAPGVQWVLVAIAAVATAHSVIQRRRTGVQLPRRIGAYPSARWLWYAVLVISLAGLGLIHVLVAGGQRTAALLVLLPVAAAIFAGQHRIRAKMRDDIAAGRIAP